MPAGQGDPTNLDSYADGYDEDDAKLLMELWEHMKDVHGLDLDEASLATIIDIVDDPEGMRN